MVPGTKTCPFCEGVLRIDCLPAADGSVIHIAVCRCGWCKACAEAAADNSALKRSGVRIKAGVELSEMDAAACDPSEAAE